MLWENKQKLFHTKYIVAIQKISLYTCNIMYTSIYTTHIQNY